MFPIKFVPLLALILQVTGQDSHMFNKDNLNHFHIENKGIINMNQVQPRDWNENQESLRIPTIIEPISYFIRLRPFVKGDKSIPSYTQIVFRTLKSTDTITLHMLDIVYNETSFLLQRLDGSGETIEFSQHSYNVDTEYYEGSLEEHLLPNEQYRLSFEFEGILISGKYGFYQESYLQNGEEIQLAATQLQPTYARRVFPCFDEPSFKATFQLEIGRENSHTVLSNTPIISTRPIDGFDDWTWDLFDVTPVMSSYLVSIAVSDFVKISTVSKTGVEINIWTRPEMIQFAEYSLNVTPRLLTFFEEYFEIPFPLPKIDQIAIPNNTTSAMENYGLIPYGESLLLWNPVLGTTADKRRVAHVISHEMSHQWHGNLVTAQWWDQLWLNEGIAAFFGCFGTYAIEPDMDTMIEFVMEKMQLVFTNDDIESSLPVITYVETPEEIYNMFNINTNYKGACVLRMMEHFLTPETFRLGLRNYLKANAYQSVVQDYLFNHMNVQAKLDNRLPPSMNVKEIMDSWTLQPGFPLITVTINGDGSALLTQERYLSTPSPDCNEKYWVPISYASDKINSDFDSAPTLWMSPLDLSITITGLSPSSSWHIFNIQQAYLYRVNYDEVTWNGIADHLANDYSAVDTRNRVQLVDDSFTLAEAGIISFDIPFSIASYLNNEDHFVPWKSYLAKIGYIEQMFSTTVAYSALRRYLRRIIYPVYDLVGAVDNNSDDDGTLFLRDQIVPWACAMFYQPCLDSAIQKFSEWMSDPNEYSIISPNLKAEMYCSAVRDGNEEEWRFALNRYQLTPHPEEKRHLLFAMACSQDHATLYDYINLIYNGNGEISKSSAVTAFCNIASTDTGRYIAWNYLINNYHDIAAFHGSYETVQLLAQSSTREFNTQKDLLEISAFKENMNSEGINTEILDTAIGTVKSNIAWMERNYDAIAGWLYVNGY